jgi:protoporphyrinogen/coproporphyrinogen III oxidase
MADKGPSIAIVGGGITGLAAAWEVVSQPATGGATPTVWVLEADDRVGGRLAADSFAGRTVDLAADAFVARRPEAVTLCEELGLHDSLVSAGASGASVWARGQLRQLPTALNLGVPTKWSPLARSGVLTLTESVAAAMDLVRPHQRSLPTIGDRAVGEVVGSRLGRPVVERLVDPLVGGINAGSADQLSAAALFPLLIAADHQPGSLMRQLRRAQPPANPSSPMFISLRTSAASLAEHLAAALTERGVHIRRGVQVDAVERVARDGKRPRFALSLYSQELGGGGASPAGGNGNGNGIGNGKGKGKGNGNRPSTLEVDAVVLAVHAHQTAVLLAPLAPLAAGLLSNIEHASVATITLALSPGTVGERAGTGFLVPRTSLVDHRVPLTTACTYLDRKWPHLARPGDDLVRLSVGRHGDNRHADLDDAELVAATTGELAVMLGTASAAAPLEARVTRWPAAFPQYAVGHLLRVAQIMEDVDSVGGLAVAGGTYRGVGVPACIGSGRDAARRLLDALAAGGNRATAER